MIKFILAIQLLVFSFVKLYCQTSLDSITISKFLIRENLYRARWKDTLKAGTFSNYLGPQKTIWVRPTQPGKTVPPILSLTTRVKANGTEDIAACFIPRHSMNFYKGGKIIRFLLVCFECEGVRFSDDPIKPTVKSITAREKQMKELKNIFKDMIDRRSF